jgi:hypothetical protein
VEIPGEITEKLAEFRFEFDDIRGYLVEDGRQHWEGARILFGDKCQEWRGGCNW